MNRKQLIAYGAISLVLLAQTGCAAPGRQPPPARAVTAESLNLPANRRAAPVSPTWWRQLNDETLNRLIDQALAQSPDLAAAAARLRQAEAAGGLAASQRGVQIGITADGAGLYHESLSNPDSLVADLFGTTAEAARIRLQGRWTWDLWGQHKSELAAALGKARAAAYEIAQTRLLLAQAVSAQYMQLQTLYAQKDLLQKRLDIKKQQETLAADRVRAGVFPPSGLYPLQNAQQQLQNAIRDLDEKAVRIRHALAALSGMPPAGAETWQPQAVTPTPMPPADTLSADLLGNRADLAAQREALLARGHLVDAARAKFYPNIQINALAGMSVLKIGDFPSSGSLLAGLLPSISLPIFTSGALQANLRQKQAEYDEQTARYNRSVYQALKEAADALAGYQAAADRIQTQEHTLRIARKSIEAAQDRVRAGLETRIAVLTAQDEAVQAQSRLLQLNLQQRLGWVALNTAFGGGFQTPASR